MAASKKIGRLHDDPGHLLRRAQQNASKTFRTVLSSYRITPIQYAVLKGLSELGPSIQRHLSEHVGVDPGNMHDMLKRMDNKSIIRIAMDSQGDRREKISLTAKGKKILENVNPMMEIANENLIAMLNAEEQQYFRSILAKIARI